MPWCSSVAQVGMIPSPVCERLFLTGTRHQACPAPRCWKGFVTAGCGCPCVQDRTPGEQCVHIWWCTRAGRPCVKLCAACLVAYDSTRRREFSGRLARPICPQQHAAVALGPDRLHAIAVCRCVAVPGGVRSSGCDPWVLLHHRPQAAQWQAGTASTRTGIRTDACRHHAPERVILECIMWMSVGLRPQNMHLCDQSSLTG